MEAEHIKTDDCCVDCPYFAASFCDFYLCFVDFKSDSFYFLAEGNADETQTPLKNIEDH